MIDRLTGALAFDNRRTALHPDLTRAQFLKSDLARGAKISVKNGVYCSWQTAKLRALERVFLVVASFKGTKLTSVDLTESDPRFDSSSWDDWTEAKEKARKKSHDALLVKILGRSRKFSWGKVSSEFDPRAAESSIVIAYRGVAGA